MKIQYNAKIKIITLFLASVVVVLLSLTGCSSPAPASGYTRFSNPDIQFSIDYPADWQYQISTNFSTPRVFFSGKIDDFDVSIAVVIQNKSYQALFDQFNNAQYTATLEYQDKVEDNVTYSTFTQTIGAVFTRNYICKYRESTSILLAASVTDSVLQYIKDNLNAYALHMVGSLQ